MENDAPEKELSKQERMELGLAVLDATRKPGETFTYEAIAAYAGCTPEAIRQTETKALEKLKKAMGKQGMTSMVQA